jgi:hypothetical protein
VSQAGNRFEFTDFLRNALDTAGRSPHSFHQRIVRLVEKHQIETIISTAYDDLLERAFQQEGVGFNRVVRGADVSFIRPGRPTLIKLYGDVSQPDTLVVTDRDHTALLRDREREPLLDEVRQAFRRNTVLFLGYSLADPDFRFLFDQVAESRFARTAYAVWPGLPEADVRMWRDRGITILEEDPLTVLEKSPHAGRIADQSKAVPPPAFGPDYQAGLRRLRESLTGRAPDRLSEFFTLEARLLDNLRSEQLYGSTETTRAERATILYALNQLAHAQSGISFNDLCQGQAPPTPQTRSMGNGDMPGGPSGTCQVSPSWNTAAIRDLLSVAFNDEELTTLCFDYFRPVQDDFAAGMSKGQKIQRLLDYCIRQEEVDDLLAAVRKANPKQYQRFEGELRG